jgi:hypothetical protein
LIEIVAGAGGGRAGDEIIVDDVVREIAAGIRDRVSGLIVVNDVVDVDGVNFREGLAFVAVGEEVVTPGESGTELFCVGAELLEMGSALMEF